MDQLLLSNFIVKREFEHEGTKHERIYMLGMHPYSPWDEIEDVLEQFKKELAEMRALQASAIQAAKEKTEAESAAAESTPVEAEIVA